MHPVNELLSFVGMRLSRAPLAKKVPREFERRYAQQLELLEQESGGFSVFKEFYYDGGTHPACYFDYECEFAARHLQRVNPGSVLDIGSYRVFVLGVLASFKVTTLDIRPRVSSLSNESIVTSDAKQLEIPSETFDMVTSLCSLEHFGLGRYGDEFDITADRKAFSEMVRVLKPGGTLVFSTTITRSKPSIAFNAHRIYDHEMIRAFCKPLECVEEGFYSNEREAPCAYDQIVDVPRKWDVYCGCWRKNGRA